MSFPDITPIRDADVGFGFWPWSQGPLFRLEEDHIFLVRHSEYIEEEFIIPSGYEFDKASIPSILWGFPCNYTPDGLCTIPALEHDYLCDLYHGGSKWLKDRLGVIPEAPSSTVIHRHFYDRLLQCGVRPSKASAMYEGVRKFGPGSWIRPSTWRRK
jgi:hypothetical protein